VRSRRISVKSSNLSIASSLHRDFFNLFYLHRGNIPLRDNLKSIKQASDAWVRSTSARRRDPSVNGYTYARRGGVVALTQRKRELLRRSSPSRARARARVYGFLMVTRAEHVGVKRFAQRTAVRDAIYGYFLDRHASLDFSPCLFLVDEQTISLIDAIVANRGSFLVLVIFPSCLIFVLLVRLSSASSSATIVP